jgi:hypothetical protein
MNRFDATRARLNDRDMFQRFRVKDRESLSNAVKDKKIRNEDEILILERNGQRLAFSAFQMDYLTALFCWGTMKLAHIGTI